MKITESGGPRDYDVANKITGQKRHVVVDSERMMLDTLVPEASLPDRDGILLRLEQVRKRFPFLELIWADVGYRGEALAADVQMIGPWRLELVSRFLGAKGFEVLPGRCVVEATTACRGLPLTRSLLTICRYALAPERLRRKNMAAPIEHHERDRIFRLCQSLLPGKIC